MDNVTSLRGNVNAGKGSPGGTVQNVLTVTLDSRCADPASVIHLAAKAATVMISATVPAKRTWRAVNVRRVETARSVFKRTTRTDARRASASADLRAALKLASAGARFDLRDPGLFP